MSTADIKIGDQHLCLEIFRRIGRSLARGGQVDILGTCEQLDTSQPLGDLHVSRVLSEDRLVTTRTNLRWVELHAVPIRSTVHHVPCAILRVDPRGRGIFGTGLFTIWRAFYSYISRVESIFDPTFRHAAMREPLAAFKPIIMGRRSIQRFSHRV